MDKEEKLSELDKRIEDLERQRHMFATAGGYGGKMALQALGEIEKLRREYDDLKYGTRERELSELKRQRDLNKYELDDVMKVKPNIINRKFRQIKIDKMHKKIDALDNEINIIEAFNKAQIENYENNKTLNK